MKAEIDERSLDLQDPSRVVVSAGLLESVDITTEFRRRPARPVNFEAENYALSALAEEMANAPRNVLQKLVELALELCRAHSAGLSILEEDSGRKIFRWHAVAGQWAGYVNGTMPREISPCGTVLDRNASLVLLHPERCYPIPPEVSPAIVEVLLIPFRVAGEPVGTIWVLAHDNSRKFDVEDERVMMNLGRFASTAYQLIGSFDAVKRQLAERQRGEEVLRENERRFREMIDGLPAAIYTTDAEGRLTHFNPAAVEFSGRTPELGTDKWCVSWKIFHADGTPMPHEECPMAIALTEGRLVRGLEAIVERPDGSRLWFTPYPTPLRDAEGRIVGGINMLVDITERKRAERLIECQKQSLELVVAGATLEGDGGLLDFLARSIESQLDAAIVAIHLMEGDGYHFGAVAAPGLPVQYAEATRGMDARLELGCCSSAIMSHTPTIVRDFAKEARWPAFTSEVVKLGLRGCFTTPILSRDDKILGTFAIYYREPRDPSPHDQQLVDVVTRTVALAIERKEAEQSNIELAAIVESSDDAIIGKDLNGIITTWNKSAEHLFGYTAQEAIGQPVTMLMPPERQQEGPQALSRLKREKRVEHFETVRVRKDGSRLDVSLTISPIKDAKGHVIGASAIARDFTERKRFEEERERMLAQQRRDREFLARLIESSPVAIAVVQGMELEYTLVNPAYQSMVGWDQPLPGNTLSEVIPEVVENGAAERVRDAIRTRQPFVVQDYRLVRNGVGTWWDAEVIPFSNEKGEVESALILGWQITERKRSEAALRESEERFRTLFTSAPVAVFVCDRDGVIQHHNQRAVELWGKAPVCGVERHCDAVRLWLPNDTVLPHEQSPMVEVLRTGIAALNVELFIERPDGSRLPVLMNVAALKSGEGEILGAIASFIDITERKQAEHLLSLRATQHQALFEFAGRTNRARTVEEIYEAAMDAILAGFPCDRAAILFADGAGVMRFTAWRGLAEAYRAVVEGHSPWRPEDSDPQPILIPDVAKAEIDATIRGALEAEGIAAAAFIPIREHERLTGKFMVYCSQPREFKTEELHLFQTIATTLTWAIERKRSEERLESLVQERTAKLAETIAELEGFSYSITHDLRAPLRALQGFSQILQDSYGEKLDDEARSHLRCIGNSAGRMDKLIQDVLVYSRVLQMHLRLERVGVEGLLRGMFESYPDFQETKADVQIEGELPDVLANEAALTQCFSNLIDNAVKFVAPGTKPRVRISAEQRGERVRFWVMDNGIGIEPKHFDNIFGAFNRLSTAYEGTGIGLTIVRKAAERMGGAAGVESQLNQGSRFWIELKPASHKGDA